MRRLEHYSVSDTYARLSDLPMGRRASPFALSAFAVGRHFVMLPALGLQVQLHQPRAQEKKAGW